MTSDPAMTANVEQLPSNCSASCTSISIVVPTFNPQDRILSRTLRAIQTLRREERVAVECVIVDNNSIPPIADRDYVRSFLDNCSGARCVHETRQGLTFAKVAGINATKNDIIVFLDDDNVPGPDYLTEIVQCFRDHPEVGVWGPGSIEVEVLDPMPKRLVRAASRMHNAKQSQKTEFGRVPETWQDYYPIGMGQVVRRDVAEVYVSAIERGKLSATGRAGGKMSSAEDIQIVWEAVKMGLAAGSHPGLKLTHIIPKERANMHYLQRLAFGCAASYVPAIVESWPGTRSRFEGTPSSFDVLRRLCRLTLQALRAKTYHPLPIEVANLLGHACGKLTTYGTGRHHLAVWLSSLLRLS